MWTLCIVGSWNTGQKDSREKKIKEFLEYQLIQISAAVVPYLNKFASVVPNFYLKYLGQFWVIHTSLHSLYPWKKTHTVDEKTKTDNEIKQLKHILMKMSTSTFLRFENINFILLKNHFRFRRNISWLFLIFQSLMQVSQHLTTTFITFSRLIYVFITWLPYVFHLFLNSGTQHGVWSCEIWKWKANFKIALKSVVPSLSLKLKSQAVAKEIVMYHIDTVPFIKGTVLWQL